MSRQRREIFSEINITPLTDIFLVLLIIMMVIAPMLDSQGLKLAVPSISTDKKITEDPKAITLRVDQSGQYSIDNNQVAATMLQETLHQQIKDHPDGLIIESAPQATHGAIVMAMDAARSAGIEKIAVSEAGE